jgi:hypothetical protein
MIPARLVIPAKAGIQTDSVPHADSDWIPAFGDDELT